MNGSREGFRCVNVHLARGTTDTQVYPNCFAADVTGSGSAAPSDTGKFPNMYDPSEYTWYDYDWRGPGDGDPRDPADYVPPGPAVYGGGGASAPPAEGGDSSSSAPSHRPQLPPTTPRPMLPLLPMEVMLPRLPIPTPLRHPAPMKRVRPLQLPPSHHRKSAL